MGGPEIVCIVPRAIHFLRRRSNGTANVRRYFMHSYPGYVCAVHSRPDSGFNVLPRALIGGSFKRLSGEVAREDEVFPTEEAVSFEIFFCKSITAVSAQRGSVAHVLSREKPDSGFKM